MKVAVLFDAGFFIKRLRMLTNKSLNKDKDKGKKLYLDARLVADYIFEYALSHVTYSTNKNKHNENGELYRIFFYDCPPSDYKGHNPINQKPYSGKDTDEYKFRLELHRQLKKKRKVALRFGRLPTPQWQLKNHIEEKVLKSIKARSSTSLQNLIEDHNLTADDVELRFQQKGVDMKIGIDITSLALKKHVDKIILISGDSDFVPAAKLARREGIDFVLDPMHHNISDDLFEHIDGCSTPNKTLKALQDRSDKKKTDKNQKN